jgi:putative FmdB family regulatory protein
VPTYEYECGGCHRVFEIRQRISDPPLTICDACGGSVRRLLSAAPFILKGDGWYVTDYPSDSRKKAMDAEKSSTTASDASSSEKSDKSDKADKTDKPAPSTTKSEGSDSSSTSGASSVASKPSD